MLWWPEWSTVLAGYRIPQQPKREWKRRRIPIFPSIFHLWIKCCLFESRTFSRFMISRVSEIVYPHFWSPSPPLLPKLPHQPPHICTIKQVGIPTFEIFWLKLPKQVQTQISRFIDKGFEVATEIWTYWNCKAIFWNLGIWKILHFWKLTKWNSGWMFDVWNDDVLIF